MDICGQDLVHMAAPWPYAELSVSALRTRGWRPEPFGEFVLKICQRCNLSCSYCYVYTMADQSWHSRPAFMSQTIWEQAARRIAEHAIVHNLPEVRIILHGGEPLLAGPSRIAAVADAVRVALPGGVQGRLKIQTNGLLLSPDVLSICHQHNIRIGVSLDGGREQNDKHRCYPDGRGSFADVDRSLRLLTAPEHLCLFSGILTTIDPTSDPVASYETLLSYSPPAIEFLWPHANWSSSHPLVQHEGTPFGDWMVRLFDRWYDSSRQETRIRFFEDIIDAALEMISGVQGRSPSSAVVAVVETDGAIEQADSLKSAYDGAASTGLSVFSDSFDDALGHPGFVARQIGAMALSSRCRVCAIVRACGGGQYPHRYRAGSGFLHPTVYCADLGRVISHIYQRVVTDLSRSLIELETMSAGAQYHSQDACPSLRQRHPDDCAPGDFPVVQ